jgi:hypothetical protein
MNKNSPWYLEEEPETVEEAQVLDDSNFEYIFSNEEEFEELHAKLRAEVEDVDQFEGVRVVIDDNVPSGYYRIQHDNTFGFQENTLEELFTSIQTITNYRNDLLKKYKHLRSNS